MDTISMNSALKTQVQKYIQLQNLPRYVVPLMKEISLTYHQFNMNQTAAGLRLADQPVQLKSRKEDQSKEQNTLNGPLLHTSLAVLEWGPDLRLSGWNHHATSLFGWTAEEVLSQNFTLPGFLGTDRLNVPGSLIANEKNFRLSAEVITKEGRKITCTWHNTVNLKEDGALKSILSIAVDLPETKAGGTNPGGTFNATATGILSDKNPETENEAIMKEEILRKNSERYALVTKAANDAIWDLNFETKELYWSDAYRQLFGYDPEVGSASYDSWKRNVHPEDRYRLAKRLEIRTALPDTGFWEDEYRYIKADGSIAYIYDRGYVLYDSERKPVRMVGAMQDITRRKITEQILEKSEANFKNIFENTDTAYILLDDDARILSCNKLAAGLVTDELCGQIEAGRNYLDLITAARNAEARKALHMVLKIKQVVSYEIKNQNTDGSVQWHQVNMHPILNGEKEVLGLSISVRNISERKLSESLLKKSEANLRTMLDNTTSSYVLLDKNFRVLSFNQRAFEGYKKELGIDLSEGLDFADQLPAERKESSLKRYGSVLSGEKVSYETCFVQEDQSIKWYQMNLFPISDNTRIFGIMIATDDITERKRAEIANEKMTMEIIQRNKDLEQFAYIISHNLRSPVANITGLATILNSEQISPADQKRCVDGLALSVKKLDDVITDLNYILQVRREINERKETVGFDNLVEDIKTSINNLIQKEEVVIETDFEEAQEIFTLKSYINSIFYNLLLNSIKYRQPSVSPKIRIKSCRQGSKLILIFTDNGLGIDLEANGSKIFGLYKRFHSHTDGKGMGLYMVRTQTEILGGRISISSQVNAGTTFTLEFEV